MVIRDQAVAVASDAIGIEPLTYRCRMHVSMRVHCHFDIEAIDLAAAQRIAEELDAADIPGEYGVGFEFEDGPWEFEDPILYLDPVPTEEQDGRSPIEDFEFDKRYEGEPFSWEAANIVTELAKVDIDDIEAIQKLIKRAHDACATPEKGPTHDSTTGDSGEASSEASLGGPGGLAAHDQAAAGGDPALQAHL